MPRRTFLISVKVLVDTRGFVIRFAGVGKLGVTVGSSATLPATPLTSLSRSWAFPSTTPFAKSLAKAVVELRHHRGNLAAKHHASAAIWQKAYDANTADLTMPKKSVAVHHTIDCRWILHSALPSHLALIEATTHDLSIARLLLAKILRSDLLTPGLAGSSPATRPNCRRHPGQWPPGALAGNFAPQFEHLRAPVMFLLP